MLLLEVNQTSVLVMVQMIARDLPVENLLSLLLLKAILLQAIQVEIQQVTILLQAIQVAIQLKRIRTIPSHQRLLLRK